MMTQLLGINACITIPSPFLQQPPFLLDAVLVGYLDTSCYDVSSRSCTQRWSGRMLISALLEHLRDTHVTYSTMQNFEASRGMPNFHC
jgi:hypothetical protein